MGNSPFEIFATSVASKYPSLNLLLMLHVGVEKHWAYSQKIWVEVPQVMCYASKRSTDESENSVPSGTEQPGSQTYQNTNTANGEVVSIILKGLVLTHPIIAYFIISFVLFLNGRIRVNQGSLKKGLRFPQQWASQKESLLETFLRDLASFIILSWEEIRSQRA